MVKKPRPETWVRWQVVAAVAEAKLMRSCVISELQEPEIPPITESSLEDTRYWKRERLGSNQGW
jgi:fibronectin type 3 domain-containing protein